MIGHNQRIRATVGRQARVFDIHDAFQDQLAAPQLLDPFDIGPREARIELLGGPRAQFADIRDVLHMADDVAEVAPLRAEHAQAPARMQAEVDEIGDGRFDRRG